MLEPLILNYVLRRFDSAQLLHVCAFIKRKQPSAFLIIAREQQQAPCDYQINVQTSKVTNFLRAGKLINYITFPFSEQLARKTFTCHPKIYDKFILNSIVGEVYIVTEINFNNIS